MQTCLNSIFIEHSFDDNKMHFLDFDLKSYKNDVLCFVTFEWYNKTFTSLLKRKDFKTIIFIFCTDYSIFSLCIMCTIIEYCMTIHLNSNTRLAINKLVILL